MEKESFIFDNYYLSILIQSYDMINIIEDKLCFAKKKTRGM